MKSITVQLGLEEVSELLCRAIAARENAVGPYRATVCLLLDDDHDVVGMEIELTPIVGGVN